MKSQKFYLLITLLIGLLFVATQLFIFNGFIVPPGHDPIAHSQMIQMIAQDGWLAHFSGYPKGMHAILAVIFTVFRFPIPQLLIYATIFLSPLLFWGTYFLFWEYFQSRQKALWSVAGAFIFSPAILLLYYFGLYPTIWSLFLLPWALFLSLRLAGKPNIVSAFGFVSLLVLLFLIHPAGLINYFLYLLLLAPQIVRLGWRKNPRKLVTITVLTICVLGAIVCLQSGSIVERIHSLSNIPPDINYDPAGFKAFLTTVFGLVFGTGLNILPLLLYLLATVFFFIASEKTADLDPQMRACIPLAKLVPLWAGRAKEDTAEFTPQRFISPLKRQESKFFPWLATTFFIVLFLDSTAFLFLKPVYALLFPWAEEPRVLAYAFLAIASLLGLYGDWLWTNLRTKATMIIFVFFSGAYVIGVCPFILRNMLQRYAPVSQNDQEVFAWIQKNIPQNAIILNDNTNRKGKLAYSNRPSDGGAWIPFFTGQKILFPYFGSSEVNPEDRIYILENLTNLETDEKLHELLKEKKIAYVFYGSRQYAPYERSLDLESLLSNKSFQLIFEGKVSLNEKPARLFEIVLDPAK